MLILGLGLKAKFCGFGLGLSDLALAKIVKSKSFLGLQNSSVTAVVSRLVNLVCDKTLFVCQ